MHSLTLSNTLKIALGTLFLLFAVLPTPTHATTTVTYQGISSNYPTSDAGSNGSHFENIVTGISGHLSEVTLAVAKSVNDDDVGFRLSKITCFVNNPSVSTTTCPVGSGIYTGGFVRLTNGTYQNLTSIVTATLNLGDKEFLPFPFTQQTEHIFNPSYWYHFDFIRTTSGNSLWVLGSQTSVVSGYQTCSTVTGLFTACSSDFVNDPYFVYKTDATSTPEQTRILTIYNPLSASLQASTSVTFRYDYFFNDVDYGDITHAGGILTDLTSATTTALTPLEIVASGQSTYQSTQTLIEGHYYMWQPKLYGATSTILGNFQTFDVVTYSGQQTFLPPTSTSTIGELTLECGDGIIVGSICNLMGYLFVPSNDILNKFSGLWDNVKTKKPFGYITVTIDALTDLDTTGTGAFDLGTVPFQSAIFDPFKIAIGSILWALYAIYFYQRRIKTFDV